jgi:hypothetical protein
MSNTPSFEDSSLLECDVAERAVPDVSGVRVVFMNRLVPPICRLDGTTILRSARKHSPNDRASVQPHLHEILKTWHHQLWPYNHVPTWTCNKTVTLQPVEVKLQQFYQSALGWDEMWILYSTNCRQEDIVCSSTATDTRIKRIQGSTPGQISVGCIFLRSPLTTGTCICYRQQALRQLLVSTAIRMHTCAGFAAATTFDGLTTVLLGIHASGMTLHTHTYIHTHTFYGSISVIKTGCATSHNYTYKNLVYNTTNILQKHYKSFLHIKNSSTGYTQSVRSKHLLKGALNFALSFLRIVTLDGKMMKNFVSIACTFFNKMVCISSMKMILLVLIFCIDEPEKFPDYW